VNQALLWFPKDLLWINVGARLPRPYMNRAPTLIAIIVQTLLSSVRANVNQEGYAFIAKLASNDLIRLVF
jgi:hypothetical protein